MEVVIVAHEVSFSAFTLRDSHITCSILLKFAIIHHLAENLICCLVVLSELLGLGELLLELSDPLLLALLLHCLDLSLFILTLDIYLSASSLGARLEQIRSDSLTC